MKLYERSGAAETPGNTIIGIEADSPAERGGLKVGDRLIAAEGVALRDSLDWHWYSDGPRVEVTVADDSDEQRSLVLERVQGQPWGIELADPLFDGLKTCRNDCSFCFMKQLPEGLRPSLYVRDDDYRLSFLQGNFVTLTNLDDTEVARIIEQHISPLQVSLHAVDPKLRAKLIGKHQARGIEVLEALLAAGIEVHIQIVLVPGVNDGEALDRTLRWLAEPQRKAQVRSVGIVPVAWTKYAQDPGSDWRDPLDAARVIEQVQRYQFAEEKARGIDWVYLADEFYITAQAPFPLAKYYGGFPQYENGIGMVWGLVEDFKEQLPLLQKALAQVPEQSEAFTLVCGELIRDTLLGALSAMGAGGKIRLLPVRNDFLGGTVNVTALLGASDIERAIAYDHERAALPTTYLIPRVIFNAEGLTLDGMTEAELCARTRAKLCFFKPTAAALAATIRELA